MKKTFNSACPLVKLTEEKIPLKLNIYEGKKSDFLEKFVIKIN
jgi:hypothetical protein